MNAVETSAWHTYRRLLGYLRGYGWLVTLAMISMVFEAGASAAFMQLIKPMLNDLFIERNEQVVFWLPIIIVVLFMVRGLAAYVTTVGMARIGRGIVQTLRTEVFERYLRLPAVHFDRAPSGHHISRLTYTVEQVANATTDALKTVVLDSLFIIGLLTVMLYNSARLTVALFVLAPLVALIVYFVGRRYRRISHSIQNSIGAVTGIVDEVVSGHRVVRIYGGAEVEKERFDREAERNRGLNIKVASTNAVASALIQIVAACALAAVVYIATRPGMIGRMDPGSFMVVIGSMMVMLPSLKRLATVQAAMQRGVAAAQDLFELIDEPGERDTGSRPLQRCHGDLRLTDVSLRYRDQSAQALADINLHCPAGTVTALVGRSGSGKSSLVNLVPRFYEPDGGQILLDGVPISEYGMADLRRQIAWVGQDIVLFNDTVAHNIAYGALAGVSMAQIRAAARDANALEFIDRLPDGMNSQVGEGGALLSGGQRQRIAIARALLKDAPILILDEATSALDSESERLIQDALAQVMLDRTVLVIAHRLSTVEDADQIVVLDGGRIVEHGDHQALLAANGHYAALHRMQLRGS